jgi:signal transduction histidine kinase
MQAAVESVSLFDGPEGEVHLHMSTSPLEREVRGFVPTAAIYKSDGSLMLSYPEHAPYTETRVLPQDVHADPRVETRMVEDGTRLREVTSSLIGEDGDLYSLRISGSLAGIDHTMSVYWRTTLIGVLLFTLLLVTVQGLQAGQLSKRLAALGMHVARVREGHLDGELPEDRTGDEIAALRDVLADATHRLKDARSSQERLVADAAHELRTPLTIMRTSIDLALRRRREADELREALEETRNEVDRLTALASRLLDLAVSGQASLDRATADLKEIVLESVDAFLPEAERRHQSIATDLPDRAVASVHAPSVRQAVDNLLSNATKFAPTGSEIRVALHKTGDRWAFSVEDAGPGIPREQREAVFAPFHRGDDSPSGAGLGLAIVREVAGRHGGRAFVDEASKQTRLIFEVAA